MPLGKPLLDVLERMRIGGVVADRAGAIVHVNPCAMQLLKKFVSGELERPNGLRHALDRLLSKAGSSSNDLGTVRKQLASIYAKTDTHRQAELTLLLARLAVLP
jgi:hypothetical protein